MPISFLIALLVRFPFSLAIGTILLVQRKDGTRAEGQVSKYF